VSDADPPKRSRSTPDAPAASAPAYTEAGVDLDRDEGFIEEISAITKPTLRPEVLSSIGGFAGMFKAPERYKDPVFVAGADGVGTKLKLAAELGRYDTVGIDCVAMVVNDLIVQGAEPIVFLDYLAMNQLEPDIAKQALRGIAEAIFPGGGQEILPEGDLAKLAVPTQAIWGRADKVVPARHAEALPDKVAVHLLDDVGHMPHMEAAADVNRLVAALAG